MSKVIRHDISRHVIALQAAYLSALPAPEIEAIAKRCLGEQQ